ncbi:MAG: inorganic diphosphatase [Enterobacteriaceae bacterium]
MNLKSIPSGINPPKDLYMIIEIPIFTSVKYEISKNRNNIFVDRVISPSMQYPYNYGFINNTISYDGDFIDSILLLNENLIVGSIIRCRPIGCLLMEDEKGKDNKLIVVPHKSVSDEYNNINSIEEIIDNKNIKKIEHFFKHYKDLEKNKWTKIKKWANKDFAEKEVLNSINLYNKKLK